MTNFRDPTSLGTPRLLLRRLHSTDLDGFATVNAQPEVMRYIHDGRTLDRAATAERLATYRRHWDEHGFGLYAVEIKETGELAGFTGLAVPTFLPEIMPAVEIGWRLGRAHWGEAWPPRRPSPWSLTLVPSWDCGGWSASTLSATRRQRE